MSWFDWFKRDPILVTLDEAITERRGTLALLVLRVEDAQLEVARLRAELAHLRAEHSRLDELAHLRAEHSTMALERVQTAEKAAEDAAYQEEMARHCSIRRIIPGGRGDDEG